MLQVQITPELANKCEIDPEIWMWISMLTELVRGVLYSILEGYEIFHKSTK